jgi:hypothetical protein
MNMNMVECFKSEEKSRWGSTAISDGLAYFNATKDAKCEHIKVVTACDPSCVELEAF